MLEYLMIGLVLGLGAAIPLGPINLEMIRRNLQDGGRYGAALGLGACCADVTYMLLLGYGVLSILSYPSILVPMGVISSLILGWFALKILSAPVSTVKQSPHSKLIKPSLLKYSFEGYLLTLVNPFTVLFWLSISTQISLLGHLSSSHIIDAGLGVLLGTLGWVIVLNSVLHYLRRYLNPTWMRSLNLLGGIILLGFAIFNLLRMMN